MTTKTHSHIKQMSVQFLVHDIDKSINFYTKKLGFDLKFRFEDFYAGIVKDGCSIHLKTGKPSSEERSNKRNNTHLDIIFSVDNVEDLYNDLIQTQIEITQPLCDQPYGREFYIADPDGYIIAFLEEK
jgi:catechol 2,3-dioxygenase-like lactoylglutathione lyase family enzyme